MARITSPPFPDRCNVAIHGLSGSRRRMPFCSGRIPLFSGIIASLPKGDGVNEVQPGLIRAPDFSEDRWGGQERETVDITRSRRISEVI